MPNPDNFEELMSSTEPKIWGVNVTEQTIAQMIEQGHFEYKP